MLVRRGTHPGFSCQRAKHHSWRSSAEACGRTPGQVFFIAGGECNEVRFHLMHVSIMKRSGASMHPSALESVHEGLPDAEIARRIAGGNEDAFRLLMRRHNQTLYRTARSILKDDAEAEDAVQEAYLLAYRAMGAFRGDAKLSTWLVRI